MSLVIFKRRREKKKSFSYWIGCLLVLLDLSNNNRDLLPLSEVDER